MRPVKQDQVCAWEAKSGSSHQPYLTRDSELSIKWLLLPAKTRPGEGIGKKENGKNQKNKIIKK